MEDLLASLHGVRRHFQEFFFGMDSSNDVDDYLDLLDLVQENASAKGLWTARQECSLS